MKRKHASMLRVIRIGEPFPSVDLHTPSSAREFWFAHVTRHPFFDPMKEHLAVILLNARCLTIGWNMVSVGALNECVAHPREIFRPVIAAAAYGFVLMHNHPSGLPDPSDSDRRLTNRLAEAARIMQVQMIDHVIVGDSAHPYFSMKEANIL